MRRTYQKITMRERPHKISIFAVPSQFEFLPTGKKIAIRNGAKSLQERQREWLDRRYRHASLPQAQSAEFSVVS
jgi:hypothetical protein